MADKVIRGEATTVDLGNVSPLLLPWTTDAFAQLRPPLSVEAMRLSAELAGATYTMAVDPWMQAGWRDMTIQVDGDLTGGLDGEENWLKSRWRLHRVRSRIRQRNPIGQVMGAIRQKDRSDTGKALVMIHPAPDGRYVVAISFMGTGKRFYDWFSNFRMTSEDGLHKGFLQLTQQFEDNEADVLFPETAKELGLETLTLRHILQEARYPGSRFVLWLSGHSQGGALMQVYALRKIRDEGVLPRNIVGYGFASPSVAAGAAVNDPAALPLYHIFNSDDLVPRMGALVHLGLCLTYPADEAIRAKCYATPQEAAERRAMGAVAPLLRHMTDTPACIEAAAAFLLVLSDRSAEDMLEVLSALEVHIPLRRLISAADHRVDRLARHISRRLSVAYQSITGGSMSHARVAAMADEMNGIIQETGVRRFMDALMQLMAQPHGIRCSRAGTVAPYIYIVLEGVGNLAPWVWISGDPPRRMAAYALLNGDTQALIVRRRKQSARRPMPIPKRRAAHPARDTRHHAPMLEAGGLRAGEKLIRCE